ncbi:unnamed protein product [Pedinophyceae sp. YPF-701]|nr:unnamed protein product [Pedinophyceae sp. YPF-701]
MDPTLWKKPEMVNRLYAHVEFLKRQLTIAQADAAAAQPAGPAPGSLPPGVVTKKLSEFEAMRRAAAASSEPATPAAVLGVAEKHLCDMRCRDVCVIDLTRREGFAPADAVVLATVDSPEQVWASAGGLMYQLRVTFPGESWAHTHMYGSEGSDWVCIDLGRTMVNVLTQEGREYYDIEGQWADADGGNVRRVAGAPPPSAPQQSIADLAD